MALEYLPFEIIQHLTLSLDPAEVGAGISATSAYLRDVFSDELYWKRRCKHQYPARWKDLIDGNVDVDNFSGCSARWRKGLLRHHRKYQTFNTDSFVTRSLTPWTIDSQHNHFWSTNCVTFCDSGRILVTGGDSPDILSVWHVGDSSTSPVDHAVLHQDKVTSVRSVGHFLSSTSWDKSIVISDLCVGLTRPLLTLRGRTSIDGHDRHDNEILSGSDSNLSEIFDLRGGCRSVEDINFSPSTPALGRRTYGQPIKPKYVDSNKVLLLGSEDGTPVLKLYDRRYRKFEIEVRPTSFLSASDRPVDASPVYDAYLDEGSLWYANGPQLLQLNSSTFELVKDHSTTISKGDRAVAIHRKNGILLLVTEQSHKDTVLVDKAFCLRAYAGGGQFPLQKLWEKTLPITGLKKIAIDFSEQTCSLAVATDDSTFLYSKA